METITIEEFQAWLERYGKASAENDPRASADLFTCNAAYYESPFSEPMIGTEAIYQYWDHGARTLKDKESSHEIVAIHGNLGVARWQARFSQINSGQRIALDCIFLVEFDENRKCQLFQEWWHSQVLESGGNSDSTA